MYLSAFNLILLLLLFILYYWPLLFLIYVNDLPQMTNTSSIALYAYNTKCYRAIRSAKNVNCLQSELDKVEQWCREWRMDLNYSKCGVLKVTRNVNPIESHYHLMNNPINNTNVQKDLGVLVTSDLKWNLHVSARCTKANRMLGFVRRSSTAIPNLRIRTALYKTLIRSQLVYCSQIWSPQSVTLILDIERIQRRATKFILSLPFQTDITYRDRLLMIGLLPLTYWYEYLDLVYFLKSLLLSSDTNITIKPASRVTRRNEFPDQIILNIPRANTLTFQNSFYCRVPRIFNCLPPHLRKVNMSISQFKSNLLSHYRSLTELVYDVDVPQTFKTVCVKCHSCRTLSSLLVKMCCQ